MLDKPMVSGAIYKFEGQVSVFNYNNGPTYRCIFPEPPNPEDSPNCADIGVIAPLPGIVGTIQANEVIKIITGIGEVLSGKLLVIDTLTMHTHIFRFKLNPDNRKITQLHGGIQSCDITAKDITYSELKQMLLDSSNVCLVDVREPAEHAAGNIGGVNIPLSDFENSMKMLSAGDTIILYCASGVRSMKSAKILLQKGFKHVLNLKGGINSVGAI
jgi:adenylyltransferase/sulfurtransferase